MITEDYVSFEIAKLLKEKGFNESCYTYYDDIDDTINRFDKGKHFSNTSYPWGVPYDVSKAKKYIVAPTIQMAMKWLREVHKIYIDISPTYSEVEKEIHFIWQIFDSNYDGIGDCEIFYGKYETACEEAIRYCLENLI